MLIELIRKEFLTRMNLSNRSVLSVVFSYLFRLLFAAIFIALECFLTLAIHKKLIAYSDHSSFSFLVFFLFIGMLASILYSMVSARKTIFNQKDSTILLSLPISSSDIISSKIIFVYLNQIILEAVIATPILICFGISHGLIARFIVFAILYPFFVSLFTTGMSLLLSVGYQALYKLVKRSAIAQFVIACVLMIALCYVYKLALDMFLMALSDSSIGGVFSDSFMNWIDNASTYLLPVRNVCMMVVTSTNIFQNAAIFLGMTVLSLFIGITVASAAYTKMMRTGDIRLAKVKIDKKPMKMVSPAKALLKKEMDLLFRDDMNMFSYTSLLIMAPFLTYAVISSLNGVIFDDLKFYAAYFPELVSAINLCVILLFAGVINASASLSISREKKCVQIVKYLPIPVKTQIFCKLAIPFIFSEASFVVSLIALLAFSSITWQVALASFIIGTIMIVWNNVFGLYADMHDHTDSKSKLKVWNNFVPLTLPILLLASHFLLTTYARLKPIYAYIIEISFVLICLAPFFVGIGTRCKKAFYHMEARL